MSEVVIAVAITATAMVGIAQLMYLATRQHRVLERYSLAAIEAGNILEDLMSRPWNDLAAAESPAVALSEAFRQTAPEARLQVDVAPDGGSDDVRKITVRIHWQTAGQSQGQPVQLVAWRYRNQEATP